MISPELENIANSINHGDLPEVWRVPEIERFSSQKTLYDYQTGALKNAARALFLYYGKEHDWVATETLQENSVRKYKFSGLYGNSGIADVKKFERPADRQAQNENQVFRILSGFIPPEGDFIPYHHLINRMCFWMATGSGKTLVMVKLIEYLHRLQQHQEIPSHNILLLAPSEQLIGQIRRTIDEFNESGGLQIDLKPLRQAGRRGAYQHSIGDSVTVYYHRSDNISDVQKEALTNYRDYENDGKWFILLDEAHKGGKENSKRQAYYALMAREGFLFNFSATFTDKEDIVTTVKKYNLEEFIRNGHGKNIYLNETEYDAFRTRDQEISGEEKQKIVLKSIITFSFVSMRVKELREKSGMENLYHLPLMLTLVNSVNTDVNERNDLWAFFSTLLVIASGEINEAHFIMARDELLNDWRDAKLLFNEDATIGVDEDVVKKMKITDVREAVFLTRRKGALQFIRSENNKELAFQMKSADTPFALIRIGDTTKWRKELLVGYEETTALREKSFFDGLEQGQITILMGSRSFFESWDSNRPNVINFINIGGKDAKKFVVQSVGRGVRIEPLKEKRRRLKYLLSDLPGEEKNALDACFGHENPPETLFLFATNRASVKAVLEGLQTEKGSVFENLEIFEKTNRPQINGLEMPLLVPEYRNAREDESKRGKFSMSKESQHRIKNYVDRVSDSVLVVRDGFTMQKIARLREMVGKKDAVAPHSENNYANVRFLLRRIDSHLSLTAETTDGVRELDDKNDIVHFRQISVSPEHMEGLKNKIKQVKQEKMSDEDIVKWGNKLGVKEITRPEYDEAVMGKNEAIYNNELKIKKLAQHYYFPVVMGSEKTNYIKHIIKIDSEVKFLNTLVEWLDGNSVGWDAWMFSKIDESLDDIRIPYYDKSKNEYRNFKPDFIFWMRKGNEYRIVFVDPKSTQLADAYRKIDGYENLFEENEMPHTFKNYENIKVQVKLLMFNNPSASLEKYRRHWTDTPKDIFQIT